MTIRILAVTLAASAAFTPAAFGKEIKVAIIQPQPGGPAFIGRGIADAVVMAIEDINARGLAGDGVYNFTGDRAASFGMGILTVKDGQFVRPDDL